MFSRIIRLLVIVTLLTVFLGGKNNGLSQVAGKHSAKGVLSVFVRLAAV